ncbi:MAG: ATPase [Verrucomicrobiales bacterium]|nr:ATPase [Verrucomicrobiales bacterium]
MRNIRNANTTASEPQSAILRNTEVLAQNEAALQRHSQRAQLLAEASGRLLLAPDPRQMLRKLYEAVAGPLSLDAYFHFTASADADELQLSSFAGIPEATALGISKLHFGQATCGIVAQEKRGCAASNIQESDDPSYEFVRSLGFKAYACNPLMVEDQLLGTLSFGSHTRSFLDEEDLRFLQTLSHYVALAQARSSQMEVLEKRVAERTARLEETVGDLEHFSYSLTHDLRAPLRAMQGFSSLLLEESLPEPERTSYLQRIAAAAERMDKLVRDALDYSMVLRGELSLSTIDAHALLRAVIESSPLLSGYQSAIVVERSLPTIW